MRARLMVIVSFSASLSATGCLLDSLDEAPEDLGVAEGTAAVVAYPGITSNAVMSNAVMSNAVMSNAVMSNALNTWAGDPAARSLMDSATSRTIMKYVCECALRSGDYVDLKNSAGTTFRMNGAIGLAPSYKTGSCNSACMQNISSCMLARMSALGIRNRISVRQPADDYGPLSNPSEKELAVFTVREAAYYGSLFGPPIARRALVARSMNVALGTIKTRICGGGGLDFSTCPVLFPGIADDTDCFFADTCADFGTPGVPDVCYATNICDYPSPHASNTFTRPLTVFRPKAECPHGEHLSGSAMSASCSPCAWRVVKELGYSSCAPKDGLKRYWSSSCANAAIDHCGDHSLCSQGDPLVMGDSACINTVCSADPYCCTTEWDSICVGEAEDLCGISCG